MLKRAFLAAMAAFFGLQLQAQQVDVDQLPAALEALNSRYDEQNAILHPDGRSLYFTRANDSLNVGGPRDRGDIWVSQLGDDGRWQSPHNLGAPVNDDLKNVMLGFSPDGAVMFVHLEERLPGGMIVNNGIGYSLHQSGAWTVPRRLSVDYYTNKSRHQSGSLSPDGSVMVLSLDSYGSRGEEDLYVSFYESGRWSQPRNLGSDVNTSGQEMTPYLAPDRSTLYFSSNGHGGQGGRDLFVARRLDETWQRWSKPVNLGTEFNSEGVELWYHIDAVNQLAYFTSTTNSDGYGDIRAARIRPEDMVPAEPAPRPAAPEVIAFEELLPPEMPQAGAPEPPAAPVRIFRGSVRDIRNRQPLDAAVNIQSGEGEEILNINALQGVFSVELPFSAERVKVAVKYPGYMGAEEVIILREEEQAREFLLEPLAVGATIRLNSVLFERSTAVLIDSSYAELDRLAEVMVENPGMRIELAGHTDNQGDARKNLRLSQDRVDMVRNYLIVKGVDPGRIRGRGFGGSRPVASNANEETRKLNRRVEFIILEN
jgi:OmpA-OmpF porin, OOP family